MKNKKPSPPIWTEPIVKLQEKIEKDNLRLKKMIAKLRSECKHENTEIVDVYYSGNYYDTAETVSTTYCLICGLALSTHTESHSWYG